MFKAFVFGIFIVFLLDAASARADGVDIVDEYNVSGVLTIVGTNACPPAACAETLDFSMTMGSVYNADTGMYGLTLVPGSATVLSLGPLSDFTITGSPGNYVYPGCSYDCNYMAMFDSQRDEIDLLFYNLLSPTPITPQVTYTDLYGCGLSSPTCDSDFSYYGITIGQYLQGEVTATVTPTPEPSSLLLLGIGLFSLIILVFRLNRSLVAT